MDAFHKWPKVRHMPTTTTSHTIEVLEEVSATHGFPRILALDNGSQFTVTEFQNFLTRNRISHHKSPSYHPATNRLVENMGKNVKQWLKREGRGISIHRALATLLRTYRNLPQTSIEDAS